MGLSESYKWFGNNSIVLNKPLIKVIETKERLNFLSCTGFLSIVDYIYLIWVDFNTLSAYNKA